MKTTTNTLTETGKPKWWQRIALAYHWMSRRNKIALWGLIAALIIAGISLQWIKPAYREAKMNYFLRLAEKFVEKNDYAAASLAYRRALLSGAERPEAWKSLAVFLEKVDSPEIIGVWEKLAKFEPTVREYRYKQVAAAVKFGRAYEAQEVLNQMPEEWKSDPDYLRNLADILIQKNQRQMAVQILGRILQKNPKDEQALYDLALVDLKSPEMEVQLKAKDALSKISKGHSETSKQALRQLISIAVDAKDNTEADRLATQLVAKPGATVKDRITYVQLELMSQSLTASMSLKNLRTYAEEHPEDFGAVVDWLLVGKVDPDGTDAWLHGLSPDFAAKASVQAGLLQYYLNNTNFKEVFRILRNRSDALNIPQNVVSLAEKAIGELDQDAPLAHQAWMEAVYAAEGNPQALYYLSLISSARGWTDATGRALSVLADSAPTQPGVWNLLAKHESSAGNLAGYYKALSGLMRINPYDIHVASDWVIASVLLRKGENEQILNLAKRTYDATEPADPWAGTAYAMALLRDHRPQESLEVISRMSEANRRLPQRAIYVGAAFAAVGDQKVALDYFERAEEAENYNFPEEIAFSRIWKGVAMGEATTAEEEERILKSRKDLTKESAAIASDLKTQLQKRADPDEVRQIFSELKAHAENSEKVPEEVRQVIQQIRDKRSAPAK